MNLGKYLIIRRDCMENMKEIKGALIKHEIANTHRIVRVRTMDKLWKPLLEGTLIRFFYRGLNTDGTR